jgi:arylsulfatase
MWLIEAVKYNVLPLDDRRVERFNSDLAGRPLLVKGNSQILFGGMGRLTENSVLNLKNKSHSVTAELVVPDGGAEGVIIAQGGAFAGWALYLHDGKPAYCHNLLSLARFKVYGETTVPPGVHQVRMEFATTAAAWPRAGRSTSTSTGIRPGTGEPTLLSR